MGNVLAASTIPPPVVPPADLQSPTLPPSSLDNPGTMEDLNKKCKDIQPTNFDGAKLMVQKSLSHHFLVSHTINLCSALPNGYRFGATYVGTKQLSPNEAFPVLLGDIDSSGNLNANVIHQVATNIRCKLASQIQQNKITAAQLTADYRGDDFTASLTVGNPNIIQGSGVVVAHYLQSVTKKLAIGGELAYQYGPNVPGGELALMSAAGRYVTSDQETWTGTIGLASLHVCYHRKASDQLQFGVELETSFRARETVGTFSYQADIPKADIVFRGMIDTNWNVGGVLEKHLQPLPFTFALSGLLNHSKNQFKLGVGMMIG